MDTSLNISSKAKYASITVGEVLFYAAIFVYLTYYGISSSYLSDSDILASLGDSLKYLSLALIAFKALLFTRYTIRQAIAAIIVLTILLISSLNSGSRELLTTGLFIFGAIGLDYKKICRLCFDQIFLLLAIIILSSLLGVIESRTVAVAEVSQGIYGISVRHTLGFRHVNTLGMFVVTMLICRVATTEFSFSHLENVVWVVVALVLFFFVNTKTAAFVILATVCFQLLLYRGLPAKATCLICVILSILFIGFGIVIAVKFDKSNALLLKINDLLSGRPNNAHKFLLQYPLTLLGQSIELIGTVEAEKAGVNALILDNGYINLVLRFGLLSFISFFALFAQSMFKSLQHADVSRIFLLMLIFAIGISETWLFTIPGSIVLMSLYGTESDVRLSANAQALSSHYL